MKRLYLPVLFVFFNLFSTHAQSYWTGLNGPYGGTINDIVSPSSGVMLVSTINGVYRSADAGATWARVALGSDNSFGDLEIDISSSGNKIYALNAGSGATRIYFSSDAGLTWTPFASNTVLTTIVTKIKVTPNGFIYLTDVFSRFWKSSTAGGSTFNVVSTIGSVNDLDVDAFNNVYLSTGGQGIIVYNGAGFNPGTSGSLTSTSSVSSTVIVGSTVFAIDGTGPHKSTNGGLSTGAVFASVKNNLTDPSFSGIIDVDAAGNIYIANNNSFKIFTSTAASSGGAWSSGVAYGFSGSVSASFFQAATTWFTGFGPAGIFKTTNSGSAWSQSSVGIKALNTSSKLFITASNKYLFMGWSGGLGYFSSINDGASWTLNFTATNTNRQITNFIQLSGAGNPILGYGFGGVILSTNEGTSWTVQSGTAITEVVTVDGINLFSYSGTNLLKSVNQGATWSPTAITGLPGTPTKIQIDGLGNIYFIASNAIYKVNSGAAVANKLASLSPTPSTVQDLQVLKSGSGIFVLGNSNTLYVSADGGTTFTATTGPTGTSTNLWVYDSKNIFIGTTTGFYVSNDGGGIWTGEPLLDSQGIATDALVAPSTSLYVATSKSVMHKSTSVVIPPAAPTLLTIAGASFNEIQYVFTDNANNETNFVVETSIGDNQHYVGQNLGFALSGSTQNRYNVTIPSLTKNTLYFLRIKAVNPAGSSAYSNEVSVTTLDQCTSSIPDNRSWTATVAADPGSTPSGGQVSSATVNIAAVNNAPNNYTITNYDLGIYPDSPTNGSQGSATFVETCGQTYFYEQQQTTDNFGHGNGTWNASTKTLTLKWEGITYGTFFQGTTTLTLNATDPVPAAPSMSVYLYSSTEVLLNWSFVPYATSYDIKRATVSGGPYTTVANVAYPLVTYIDKTVSVGQQYYYVMVAKNVTGASVNSTQSGVATQNVLFRPVENDIQLNFENQQGVSWGDLDGDGDEDIASPSFTNNAGQSVPPVFYENMGNGKDFTRRDLSILTDEKSVSRDINIFDYDNDGKLDMFITRSEANVPDLLLMNTGSWNFTKVLVHETESPSVVFKTSAAIDFDNDGKADIFTGASGSDPSGSTIPTRSQLFKNTGGSSYSEITTGTLVTDLGNPRHMSWADYDNDGDQDLFITDVPTPSNVAHAGRLYKNNGDGTFTRVTGLIFDTDLFTGSRTVSWGDIDNDGDLDLYVGSSIKSQTDRLYQNKGDGTFASLVSPVAESLTPTFGSMMGDIDNDGDLDIIAINAVSTGHDGANSIFINQGTGTFVKYTTAPEMLTHPDIWEIGGAMADFDQDGFLDVYPSKGQTNTGGVADLPNLLYKNASTPSASKNWIEIKLVGVQSNRSAIGARITVTTTSPARTQIREISTLTGGGSAGSLIAHVGLGTATTIANIKVRWPSGIIQNLANVTSVNQIMTLTEDNTPPAIATLNPANNATGVAFNSKLEITFNESPTPIAGKKIKLFNGTTLVEQYDATAGVISGNKVSFTPTNLLATTTIYSISVDPGAFSDIYGNGTLAIAVTAWSFRSLDNLAPVITFQAVPSKDKGFTLPISLPVTVTDNSGVVTSLTLSYRSISTKAFTDIVLNSVTGPQTFSVPTIDEMGINYYFTAKDADNNVTRLPAAAGKYFSTRVHYPTTNPASLSLVKGSGLATDYQIVSTPWDISNADIASNFEELSGGNTNFRFLRYHELPTPGWDEYPGTLTTFARGEGYFINVKDVSSVLFTDAFSPRNNRDSLFTISLKKGWNQIGNPYTTPIQWADVLAYNNITAGLSQKLTIFSGGYQIAADPGIIQPNKGGFVLADNDIAGVKIPFQNQVSGGRIDYSLSENIAENSWEAGLMLKQQDIEFKIASIGMSPMASNGKDIFDMAVPPRISDEFIEMSVAHPEYFMKRLARDIVQTQNEFVWNFDVSTSAKGLATLAWDNSVFGNNSKELYLIDENLQKPLNMREKNSYSFDPSRSDKFKIYYGENLEKKIVPSAVVLGQAYPNPTSSITTITFTLPEQSSNYAVKLEVYDLMGKKVSTLVNGSFPSGFYSAEWDTSAQSTGLYTYRIVVAGASSQEVHSGKIVRK